jgi:raffinose/stachyose/melibiose transport system permease protein
MVSQMTVAFRHSRETERPGRRRSRRRRQFIAIGFVAPIVIVNLVVVLGPSLASIYYSMSDWSGIGAANFVGLANFKQIFTDSEYAGAFRNNVVWLLFFLTIPVAIALLSSTSLIRLKRGGLFFRAVFFVPYILPSVVVASTWQNLLHIDVGLGGLAEKLGMPFLNIAYFGRPDTSLLSAAFVDNWHFWGFLMVLFLTAMQSVPTDLYDAAKIDGANPWKQFIHVTIPGIRPTLMFMLLMIGIWSFLAFDYVWITTQGGPAGSSNLLSVLVFKNAFLRHEAGYAAAIGLTMSIFAGIIIAIYQLLKKRGWEI